MFHRSRQFSLSPREVRYGVGHRCKLLLTVSQEPKKSRTNAAAVSHAQTLEDESADYADHRPTKSHFKMK